jgi:hypothetical protein
MNEAKIIYSDDLKWLQIISVKIIFQETNRLSEDPNL